MISITDYGYRPCQEQNLDGLIPARVIEIRRDRCKVVCELGEAFAVPTGSMLFRAKQSGDLPAVGDFVLIKHNPIGDSGIAELLPRNTKFSRSDFAGHAAGYAKTILEQVVAANFDYVFIMSSLNRDFKAARIARYLIMARQSGALPVVLLTKADLCADPAAQIREARATARDIDVIPVSCVTGDGLDALGAYLRPRRTAVFLGMSGVGKSSLVNTLFGSELMEVKEIREDDARGRHTTTHRQLIMLPSGAMIIDTPGMRELGLWDAVGGIEAMFDDVESVISRCRFSDCGHTNEPGCAVREALSSGALPGERWDEYNAQKRENAFVDRKSASKNKRLEEDALAGVKSRRERDRARDAESGTGGEPEEKYI